MNFLSTRQNIRRTPMPFIPFPQKKHVDPFQYYDKHDPRPVSSIVQRLRMKLLYKEDRAYINDLYEYYNTLDLSQLNEFKWD